MAHGWLELPGTGASQRVSALYGSPADITRVLDESTLWFIVGLGDNPSRVAYGVAAELQRRGKRIVPIHPRAEIVHGEPGYRTIAEAAAVHGAPDVVDVFVRSDRAGEFVQPAIDAGARCVWFQLGVVDEAAAQRTVDAGLTMIMDTCPLIEWRR